MRKIGMLVCLFVAVIALSASAGPYKYMKTLDLKAGDIPVVSTNGTLIPSGYTLTTMTALNAKVTATSNTVVGVTSNLNVLSGNFSAASNTLVGVSSNLNLLSGNFDALSNTVSIINTNYTPLAP